MTRFLILLFLLWLAYRAVSGWVRGALGPSERESVSPPKRGRLVACSRCGTHVLEQRAVRKGDERVCESCGATS